MEMRWYDRLESNLDRAEQIQSLFFHTTHDWPRADTSAIKTSSQKSTNAINTHLKPEQASILYVVPKEE